MGGCLSLCIKPGRVQELCSEGFFPESTTANQIVLLSHPAVFLLSIKMVCCYLSLNSCVCIFLSYSLSLCVSIFFLSFPLYFSPIPHSSLLNSAWSPSSKCFLFRVTLTDPDGGIASFSISCNFQEKMDN